MTWVLGAVLGGGLVLVVSPRLWPRGDRSDDRVSDRLAPVRARLALAGLVRVPVLAFAAVSAVIGSVLAGVAILVTSVPVVGILAGVVGTVLPWVLVSLRATA
jgi:tight adherence protein B